MQEVKNNFLDRVNEDWEPTDSIIQKKIINMMEYAYMTLQNFPKAEKFSMAADMKKNMDQMLERIVEADNKHYKKTTLGELDVANKKLKKYVRLAFCLRFISNRQYRHWTELLAEIGRITGKRIESSSTR